MTENSSSGLINYAETKSENGEIERLELMIMIIKISACHKSIPSLLQSGDFCLYI